MPSNSQKRIKVLDGRVPGSIDLKMTQKALQPPTNPLDVKAVIKGCYRSAEKGAIDQYQKIIEACDGVDPVTQDLCTTLKGDEEGTPPAIQRVLGGSPIDEAVALTYPCLV